MAENENKDLEVTEEKVEVTDVEETVEQESTEQLVEDTVEVEDVEETEVETMSEALNASVEVKPGDIVEGVVLAFDDDKNVVVGLDTGHEGYIPLRELSTNRVTDPSEEVKVDERIRVNVLRVVSDK